MRIPSNSITTLALSWVTDILAFALIAIWLSGGIPWGDKLLLSHGADPRRAAILILVLGYWFDRGIHKQSFLLRIAQKCGQALLKRRIRFAVLAWVTAWACLLGVLQTLAMRYPLYDVGIFHQILWALSQGYGFHSSISGAGNFLLDHLSPSLAFIVPIYWITQSAPWTLPIVHAFLIYGGVVAWICYAERVPGISPELRSKLAATTLIFALAFDSLWSNLRWGFHENAIAFFCLSWGMALLLMNRSWKSKTASTLLFLIAAGSKETLLLQVGMIFGIWAWVEGFRYRKPRLAVGLVLTSVCLFSVFIWFEKLPHPADKNYFARYYSYLGNSLGEMIRTLFLSPGKIVETIGFQEILKYLRTVFFPFLLLPLIFIRRFPAWIVSVPSLMSALLATYAPLRFSGFHYALELWPALVLATITSLAWIASRSSQKRSILNQLPWIWAIFSLVTLGQDPWGQLFEFSKDAKARRTARERMTEISTNQSVVASELAGPWIANRLQAFRWPDGPPCPDIILWQGGDSPKWGNRRDCGYQENWRAGDWKAFEKIQ